MSPLARPRRLAALAFGAVLAAAPALAMIEHGPLALAVAQEAGCIDPDVRRIGQEGTEIVFLMQCAEGSPVLRGRIVCGIDACRLEREAPEGDS